MSYYDYTHKSGYGHNSRSYKVETYVEEVRKPRVVEYRYPSYATKIDPTYTYNHDRPLEVDNLISQILTEVNGPPVTTTISDSGTYRSHQRVPVRVESKNYYAEDPWYGSYPSNRDYGSRYNDPSLIDQGVPKHRYQPPQQEPYGYNNQQETYGSKPGTMKTFGVPRAYWGSSHQSDSPKYGAPKNQWGDDPMSLHAQHDYGGDTNPSNFRPEVSRDERDPNKRWGDSSMNSQTIGENGVPKGYRVPIYQYDDDSPMNLHNGYAVPNNPSLSKPERSQTRQDYGVPSKPESPKDHRAPYTQWGGSPVKSQTRQDYEVPSKPESPKDHRAPYTQWGGSPVKSQTRQDYGVPSKPESPKDYKDPYTQWGGSPVKSQTRQDYGVPSTPESPKDHRAPYTQWGGSPAKSQTRQDYEVPVKPETPKDHRGPYIEWGSSPKNSHNPGNNGVPNNQQNLSSGPNVYEHPDKHPPTKFDTSKNYGAPENKVRNSHVNSPKFRGYGDPSDQHWDSPSKQAYSQPPNTQFPSQPKTYNEQDHSPIKQQTYPNYTTPSHSYEPQPQPPPSMTCKDGVCTLNDKPKVIHNPYDEPKDTNIRNYPKDTTIDHVQNDGRSSPYTIENQPKKDLQNASTNWRNSPSGNNNNTRTSTPFGKATNTNIEEPLGKFNITEGSSPNVGIGRSPNPATLTSPGVGLSSPTHSRPKTEHPKESTQPSIDSKEAAKRYVGLGVPSRPYSSGEDLGRAISSIEAVEKYNGSIVPK